MPTSKETSHTTVEVRSNSTVVERPIQTLSVKQQAKQVKVIQPAIDLQVVQASGPVGPPGTISANSGLDITGNLSVSGIITVSGEPLEFGGLTKEEEAFEVKGKLKTQQDGGTF